MREVTIMQHPIRERIMNSIKSRRRIALPQIFVRACGDNPSAAIMLTQLVYWSDSTQPQNDHWIYKSATMWRDETGLTSRRIRTGGDYLVKHNLVDTKTKAAEGHNTRWYKVNVDNLVSLLNELQETIDDAMGVDHEDDVVEPEDAAMSTYDRYMKGVST